MSTRPLRRALLVCLMSGRLSAGSTKAYPFSVLARAVGAAGELQDTVAGQAVRIRYDREHGTAEAFDAQGRPLASTLAFWFAWVAFHPRTKVLRLP